MHCPRCDVEIPDRSVFCFNCGARVSSAQPVTGGAGKAPREEPPDLGSQTLVDLSRDRPASEAQVDAPIPVDAPKSGSGARVQGGRAADTFAQTAPFEPSPLASAPSLAAASSWSAPLAAAPSSWGGRAAPGPAEDDGSRWQMPVPPQRPGTEFVDLGAEAAPPPAVRPPPRSSSVSMVDLELRLSRRRQLVHWLLWVLIAAFLLGAIYFFIEGFRSLRGPSAAHAGDGDAQSSTPAVPSPALTAARPPGEMP